MKFLFFRSTWGMETPSLGDALIRIKQGGFDGVELGVPDTEAACLEAKRRCDDLGLLVVVQQWTAGRDNREHSASFEAQYRRALLLNPVRVNSHTGKDHYSLEQNLEVFDRATALEHQEGVPVVHETHRRCWRINLSSWGRPWPIVTTYMRGLDFHRGRRYRTPVLLNG
ncbi:MAG: hypothetical protein NTX27_02110 [Verrucomicrobia bacterium]|nr:hypothetical protein [Verrucomicrobiota bacterium]